MVLTERRRVAWTASLRKREPDARLIWLSAAPASNAVHWMHNWSTHLRLITTCLRRKAATDCTSHLSLCFRDAPRTCNSYRVGAEMLLCSKRQGLMQLRLQLPRTRLKPLPTRSRFQSLILGRAARVTCAPYRGWESSLFTQLFSTSTSKCPCRREEKQRRLNTLGNSTWPDAALLRFNVPVQLKKKRTKRRQSRRRAWRQSGNDNQVFGQDSLNEVDAEVRRSGESVWCEEFSARTLYNTSASRQLASSLPLV